MSSNKKSPHFQNIWGYVREKMIMDKHRKVAGYWNPVIRAYMDGKIEKYTFAPLRQFPDNKKIIWQYWGQGLDEDSLPGVVRICFASVDKYKGEYEVVRLCDDTVKDYLQFPAFVWEKKENGQLSRTFFSDLLRLALLNTYGGVWLDATILLTAPLPELYARLDYFVFQRDDNEENKKNLESPFSRYWGWKPAFKVKMLNSIIFARKDNEVIRILMDLMLYYWKTRKKAMAYFFFQILYHELMERNLPDKRCPVQSDFIPHYIQAKLLDPSALPQMSYKDVLQKCSIHKMAYYKDDAERRFYSFVREFTGLSINLHL